VKLRAVASALLVAIVAGLTPAAALADGDPASDVLVTQPIFVPWNAGVSAGQQGRLAAVLREAARAHDPFRVALIASAIDLGTVTALWRAPESYAQYVGEELSLVYRGNVLVVMPNGFGLYRHGISASAAERTLAVIPRPANGTGLAPAASSAVVALAAAAGHKLALPAAAAFTTQVGPGSTDIGSWLVLIGGLALIALAWSASARARPLRLPRRAGHGISSCGRRVP
jgi:hypothetical protein